jgi:DNA modification methylase
MTNKRKLSDLALDSGNANKGTERGRQAIEASIREFGFADAGTLDKHNTIIGGNKRTLAAGVIGMNEAIIIDVDGTQPVYIRRNDLDLSSTEDDRARRLAYALNRSQQLSLDWDTEQLMADLNAGFDLSALFRQDELDELIAQVDEAGDSIGGADVERMSLAERFLIPPFSVLDARQGYWQNRKSAWLALGIQSELGRGITEDSQNDSSDYGAYNPDMGRRANATPGGSLLPAATLGKDGKTVRGDGKGRRINGKLPADNGGQPLPLDRTKNGKGLARKSGQDLMKGEHVVGENRLTWVSGDRDRGALDETSRKNLAAGRKPQMGYPHGPTVTQNPDGTLNDSSASRDKWLEESDGNAPTGTSIFDPVLCEIAYSWFCSPDGSILDPFAGGSVRGIVAAYLGRKYTGVDLRAEQIAANVEQARRIVPDNQPSWIVGDSSKALPDGMFDFVFSCPPYADLEVYSDNPQDISTMDYPEFLAVYRSIVRQSVDRLADNRFACFVVGDVRDKNGIYRNFVSDTIAAFQDAGAMLYNEAILVTAVGSLPIRVGKQFASGRKLGKTHQNVLVFVKGNPKKATEACGVVEIADLYSTDDVGA